MNNIMLVGLGPHSKRIYMNYFKKHNIEPKVLVDLESNLESIKKYLKENNFLNTLVWCLPDKYKDYEELPKEYEEELKKVCSSNNITHIISSTEPKAHNMYLVFALKNNIHILSDKPITVLKGMDKLENIKKVRDQYYNLLKLYNKKECTCFCKIMCQREFHKGYKYIKELLKETIQKYNIPITYIDIYHCDGNWEMPHDLNKENHPYKYGYGKLYHSGYHFIELLAELLKLNNLTTQEKHIKNGVLYGNIFTPNDEKEVFNKNDFEKIFFNDKIEGIYDELENLSFENYGEKNYYSLLNFTNKNNKLITTANLNLLHYGFSRRGWFESKDYYKSNGRIRHERVNIQVGPLLNIQVHSYQSKEIKDRTNSFIETETGGLEHFDIDIYRNVDLIGGKTFERIKLKDLYDKEIFGNSFLGYNEYSREEFIRDFLAGKDTEGDLLDQSLAIEILYSASKIIYDKNNSKTQIEKIKIPK